MRKNFGIKLLIYIMNNIYYLFSSITFLQFYIPIVIEGNKKNYQSIFIIRNNYKDYANPYNKLNMKILDNYIKKYKIIKKNSSDINLFKLEGIIFMVDGDIYGPPREKGLNQSLLKKLNKKIIKISLIEHMNYKWVYNHYIENVDYCIFPNKAFTDQFNFNSTKNIYLGNTKYDNIPNKDSIYKKYSLGDKEKYCLILFPKPQFRKNYKEKELLKIYNYLKKLNYKIIVKTRPKDNIKNIKKNFYGDKFICSDIYPNESLELMKISNLCIMFSSSASDETIFSEIPCLDLQVDFRDIKRNNFFINDKVYKRINNWKDISLDKLKNLIESMESKNSIYFNKLKEKYLFNHLNSAEKYFEFIKNQSDF